MREVRIPKKSGGHRVIVVPSARRKRQCRDLIAPWQQVVRAVCDLEVVHGFAPLRSPVTNALKHVGYEYTLSFDLADFFDHVNVSSVEKGIKAIRHNSKSTVEVPPLHPLFHYSIARQGLPTSPILANVAAAPMDKDIQQKFCTYTTCPMPAAPHKFCKWPKVYTRYADDLTFSTNDIDCVYALMKELPELVAKHGFALNTKKTRLQRASAGRRIITGVAVDDTGIYPTRATKRRLRAAIHNAKTGKVKHFPRRQWTRYVKTCKYRTQTPMPKQAWLHRWLHDRVRGLEEWMQLKPPNTGRRSLARIAESSLFEPQDAMAEVAARMDCCNP